MNKYCNHFIVLLLLCTDVWSAVYTLKSLTAPQKAVGGEVFQSQPTVAVLDSFGQIALDFAGSCYVNMGNSPTGFEPLYLGSCDYTSCGTRVLGTIASVPFVNGIASFTDLMIKGAGDGYTLTYIGRDEKLAAFAFASSPSFSVEVGSVYKMAFSTFLGSAGGGVAFLPNPVIIATDRGENLVNTVNNHKVTAYLSVSPTGIEQLKPADLLTVQFYDGIATFQQLYINETGSPYKVSFYSDMDINGFELSTNEFAVSTGQAAKLTFAEGTEIENANVLAGEFFNVTPQIVLRDIGGNIVESDSESAIVASIYDNPAGAKLGLTENLFVIAARGRASFTSLTLDKVGRGFRLEFVLSQYDSLRNVYLATDISLLTAKFDVVVGPPRQISSLVAADRAWAGGQPFKVQPKLLLLDYGGNTLVDNEESILTASLIPSLSMDYTIKVATDTSTVLNSIESVTVDLEDGTYGAGQQVKLYVHFRFEIWLNTSAATAVPTISLALSSVGGTGLAYFSSGDTRTRTMTFVYDIIEGDNAAVLEYASITSLNLNGNVLYGGSFVEYASMELPAITEGGISVSKTIVVDTSTPAITAISTTKEDGEYGAGEEIFFMVTFDAPIAVSGTPLLSLNVLSKTGSPTIAPTRAPTKSPTAAPSRTPTRAPTALVPTAAPTASPTLFMPSSAPTATTRVPTAAPSTVSPTPAPSHTTGLYDAASYSSISDDKLVLTFRYVVPTDIVAVSQLGFSNTEILLTSPSDSIKRDSPVPFTVANLDFSALTAGFAGTYSIQIDTSPPILDTAYGVTCDHGDGTYYPGEVFQFFVKFDKPIAAFGASLNLFIATGAGFSGIALINQVLSDNQTIQFDYLSTLSVNIEKLDIESGSAALFMPGTEDNYIRRLSTFPMTNVDTDTSALYNSGNTLRSTSTITVSNPTPTVLSVSKHSETMAVAGTVLYPDDIVVVQVVFSTPVMTQCSPVVVIDVSPYNDNTMMREAVYSSGNNTDTFLFEYTAKIGDQSNAISYRYTPNAFCLTTSCISDSITGCKLYAVASVPSLVAEYVLPISSGTVAEGVPIAALSIDPNPYGRVTTVTSAKANTENEEIGAGTFISFNVDFSDEVVFAGGLTNVTLHLSIGKYAAYGGGAGSSTLLFTYVTTLDDAVSDLIPEVMPGSTSALRCELSEGCSLTNKVGGTVDLTMTDAYANIFSSNVVVDVADPFIVDIYTDKVTSPYDGVYTVGETMYITVEWSKPVYITAKNPSLRMELGQSTPRYAEYDTFLSDTTYMVFYLVIEQGDYSLELTYDGIDAFYPWSPIYRASTVATSLAIYDTPMPAAAIARNGNSIVINTLVHPTVLSVVSLTPDGRYTPGDEIYLELFFSQYVVADGLSHLALRLGTRAGKANFIGTEPTYSTENYKSPTKNMYFKYVVEAGDFNHLLDYVDTFSFIKGVNEVKDPTTILSASANPTQIAVLDLVRPGMVGSLSGGGGAKLYIDGYVPYMTNFKFLTRPVAAVTVNDVIDISMSFSAPVEVIGDPFVLMETGLNDRPANYYSGSGTQEIIFRYIVQPGDTSDALDYYGDRAASGSALYSFDLNGGQILSLSSNSSLPAFVRLNPIGGVLQGNVNLTAIAGGFDYLDLSVPSKGPDYLLRFSSAAPGAYRTLSTTQDLFVSFSNELELRPSEALKGHRVGHSVDIYGDIAVVGAPMSNLSVTTIQTVTTTTGYFSEPVQEVQVFGITVDPQPGIVQFYTTAKVGETISGTFSIDFGEWGGTNQLAANIDGDGLQAYLKFFAPKLGVVEVTQEPYVYCACNNAYLWTLTFVDITEGLMPTITFDTSMLSTKSGVINDLEIVGPIILQSPAWLDGSFNLHSTLTGLTSVDIDSNAEIAEIRSAIESIGLTAVGITLSATSKSSTRNWEVTFDHYNEWYQIPELQLIEDNLIGNNIKSFVKITRLGYHGSTGINGNFTLEFRGFVTEPMPYNVTAADMKIALERLDTINMVNVERSLATFLNTYTWTIEFVETRTNSPRGFTTDDTHNVEPLVAGNYLIGSQTDIIVASRYTFGDVNKMYKPERLGTHGDGAGRVYIYQRSGEQSFSKVAVVVGNSTDENDQFGFDVALHKDYLLVGAIAADLVGVRERQGLFCSATGGTFKITFRGWTSAAIPYDVDRESLARYITASSTTLVDSLVPLQGIVIDDWVNASDPDSVANPGLCNNHTAVITFLTPVAGAPVLNAGIDNGPDLEVLGLVSDGLDPGNALKMEELTPGTLKPEGVNSDTLQQGSAYLFKATYDCDATAASCIKSNWVQEAQFFPLEPTGFERFGYSVAVTESDAAVGSPGSNNEAGRVYLYSRNDDNSTWTMLQAVKMLVLEPGDNFGHAVALQDHTLVVGAPYSNSSRGAAYVFKRSSTFGGSFIFAQSLTPLGMGIFEGDEFGCSVALEDNMLVVGACAHDSPESIYFGSTAHMGDRVTDTGAVYVFKRRNAELDFGYFQKLTPTNVRRFDRFGYSLDIHTKTIVVGAVERYDWDAMQPSTPIISVKTVADDNMVSLSNSFKLQWLVKNSTYVPKPEIKTVHGLTGETTEEYERPKLKNIGGPGMELRTTRSIPYNVNAPVLKTILEADLGTGNVIVSRSRVDVNNRGYEWKITFLDFISDGSTMTLFEADSSDLLGTNARVEISFVNPAPPRLRGLTHVFQQEVEDGEFVEQIFVSPFSDQPMDRCGYDVAIYADYTFVGCPNRDTSVSNANAGSAIVFYTSLLSLKFSNKTYEADERVGSTNLTVQRFAEFDYDVFFFLHSLDRNSDSLTQLFLQQLYGIKDAFASFPKTIADMIQIYGTAIGRTQSYGSTHKESRWVNGLYDYRGISDYVEINNPWSFLVEYDELVDQIVINPDTILETPNENVSTLIHAPGIWPSPLGRLFNVMTVHDQSDVVSSTGATDEVYAKLYIDEGKSGSKLGEVVSVDSTLNVMISGTPTAIANDELDAGLVYVFTRTTATSKWYQVQVLSSPNPVFSGHFGEAAVVTHLYDRNIGFIVVGEPTTNSVHVYKSTNTSGNRLGTVWDFEITLTVDEATMPQHRFGERGTIGIDGFLLVVGAPGLEAIYVFLYSYDTDAGAFSWVYNATLRASDYDYDIYAGVTYVHQQEFGKSVAVSGRTVIAGAPYADYDKLGSDLVELDWLTEGTSIKTTGRGKVYIFDSYEAKQIIVLSVSQQLSVGEFVLNLYSQGINATTDLIPYSATLDDMKTALLELENIDDVDVSSNTVNNGVDGFLYSWTITFRSEFEDPPLLIPRWSGYGCENCTAFDQEWPADPEKQIEVTISRTVEEIVEYQKVVASDRRQGDRFGYTLAIDQEQMVVGAYYSSAVSTSSWDFEDGILQGWSLTGTAFDYQPTYGDNGKYRTGYMVKRTPKTSTIGIATNKETSNLAGNYYVGTYEKRPGSSTDYRVASDAYPQGNIQGDVPVGTMTSQAFTIRGTSINFLIGGGCDIFTIYVSLLVDGMEVGRITGECTEYMERKFFDVTAYYGRSAQLRVVDDSSSSWGHINVDDFKFDWDTKGAVVNGTADATDRTVFGGHVETPQCGAAYAFRRHITGSDDFCGGVDRSSCSWTEETKLMASDKRSYAFFGSSISVNDDAGIIVIGAPNAHLTGFYKELMRSYPYIDSVTGGFDATGPALPLASFRYDLYANLDSYAPFATGTKAVASVSILEEVDMDDRISKESGAVYVFRKTHAIEALGSVAVAPYWSFTEQAKVQPPDAMVKDHFGTSVSIDNRALVIGAPGQDGYQPDGGAMYYYNSGFGAVYFQKPSYVAVEGTDSFIAITIERDLKVYAGEIVLEYATSDLTARGVDTDKFDACLKLPTVQRNAAGCYHYEQTSGVVTLAAGSSTGGFTVRIMNDLCRQHYFRNLQLTMSVPGSASLQGEIMQAMLRIDDDDFILPACEL